jgi:hypothetical protein
MTSGRLFSANMHEFCRHCQNLLLQVYSIVYKVDPETIEFTLSPMPRMEVESVNDLKVLFEIGALTPDMSIELSRVLLGNTTRAKPSASEKRKRVDDEAKKGDLMLNNNPNDKKKDGGDTNFDKNTKQDDSKKNGDKSYKDGKDAKKSNTNKNV